MCRGHADLLCIVPIITDDPRRESTMATTMATTMAARHGSTQHTLVRFLLGCCRGAPRCLSHVCRSSAMQDSTMSQNPQKPNSQPLRTASQPPEKASRPGQPPRKASPSGHSGHPPRKASFSGLPARPRLRLILIASLASLRGRLRRRLLVMAAMATIDDADRDDADDNDGCAAWR